jgi:spermidine synthase
MSSPRLRSSLLYLLFCFSGTAALGYQLVWAKMFAAGLGHEMPAALAVVAAFMGGMAAGSWLLDRRISRSPVPARWYVALELVIGGWAVVSVFVIPKANEVVLRWTGVTPSFIRQWLVAFAIPFVVLLPATAAMGATFPAMERFVARLTTNTRNVGAVYAANTLGAVLGTLGAVFVFMPLLGLRRSILVLAAVNFACAATAFLVQPKATEPQKEPPAQPRSAIPNRRLALTLFVTGLLGIGCETVAVRVLSQVLENTIYSFAAVLAVFLLGTAAGAAIYHRLLASRKKDLLLTDTLGALAIAVMLSVFALHYSDALYEFGTNHFGTGKLSILALEMFVAAVAVLAPTLCMGALFSQLALASRREGSGIGRAAAFNTMGGAVAPALFSIILLPAIGSKWTLVLIALGYAALFPSIARRRWFLLIVPVALVPILPRDLHFVRIPAGGKLLDVQEGAMASAAVVEDATGNRTLRVNNRFQMGGTGAADAEYRQADLPLLLHRTPKRALFLGVGTGITMGAASLYPELKSDGVELVPEVVDLLFAFEPHNYFPRTNAALKIFTADARRFLAASEAQYDVIVADLFHPARDGAGSLYTIEHFRNIRARLAPSGLFCQWLPLHQLDEPTLRLIVRTFIEVFPEAQAWLLRFNVDIPVVGLVGGPIHAHTDWLLQRAMSPELTDHLKKLGLGDSVRLFGQVAAGPDGLRRFAGDGPLNTDDNQLVTLAAPEFVYRKDEPSSARLTALLRAAASNAVDALHIDHPEFRERVAGYLAARDVYLAGLIAQQEGRTSEAIDAFVESARRSADFTLGYAQCLTIATVQAPSQPAAARALLQRLIDARPSQPVAHELLRRLEER